MFKEIHDRPRCAGLALGWLGAIAAVSLLHCCDSAAWAVEGQPVSRARPVAAKPQATANWQVLETANFRIINYGSAPVGAEIGEACEHLRDALCAKWHTDEPTPAWAPKCDVVLHPSDTSYLREVGAGAVSTVASSLVDHHEGKISLRRVDVRTENSQWISAALPHELTHVVLAECFVGRVVPRWIDEGAALLADPQEKQLRHKAEMKQAYASRNAFRVVELLTLEDYPANHRWGAFYGQSLSLVEYLTAQRSTDDFVHFVELSFDKGYDASLREVYGLTSVADLERCWKTNAALPRGIADAARPEAKPSEVALAATSAE